VAIELIRMVVDQIQLGQPLPFGVRDEKGKLLLAKGSVVVSEAQLQTLRERGLYADHDDSGETAAGSAGGRRLTLFDMWKQTTARLDLLLGSLSQPGFAARCDGFAGQLMALTDRDPDIGIYLSMRQDPNRLSLYGLSHALHCALVGQLAARRAGWPDTRVRTLVKAALTMNLSIVEVQGRFATMGRLNDSQRAQIRTHPQEAHDQLQAAGVDDFEWLLAVLQHHEQPGGGGYPNGMSENISEMALLLRMADVFMAKISPRTERPAMPIQEAARQLYAEAKDVPNAGVLAAAIIKEYGIFPPGNFVHLASGETAVVVRRGATAHTPVAAAVTDKNGVPMVRTLLRNTAEPAHAIRGLAAENRFLLRVPPERLYGLVG
jgi:HD-GYP domain-containing protein (c-di-GMP phosphodiesterase class II)